MDKKVSTFQYYGPNRTASVLIGIVGVIMLFNAVWWGLLPLAIAALIWAGMKAKYFVSLHTAGGESKALVDTRKDYISEIVNAINTAIVHRG